MAAISDDTAALVAAQLTVAWAARAAGAPSTSAEADVLAMYLKFKGLVSERDVGSLQKVQLGGV